MKVLVIYNLEIQQFMGADGTWIENIGGALTFDCVDKMITCPAWKYIRKYNLHGCTVVEIFITKPYKP